MPTAENSEGCVGESEKEERRFVMSESDNKNVLKSSKGPTKPETNEQLLAILADVLATMQQRRYAEMFDLETGFVIRLPFVRLIDGTLKDIFNEK